MITTTKAEPLLSVFLLPRISMVLLPSGS